MEDFNIADYIGYIVTFVIGFLLGKKVASMGFFFMLILAVGGYILFTGAGNE